MHDPRHSPYRKVTSNGCACNPGTVREETKMEHGIIKTKVQRNYGTDHEYIIEPKGLATLWEQVTGRKTVTDYDMENISKLKELLSDVYLIWRG